MADLANGPTSIGSGTITTGGVFNLEVILSGLNAAAATITLDLRMTRSATVYKLASVEKDKAANGDTTFFEQFVGAGFVTNDAWEIFATSSNASDTAVTATCRAQAADDKVTTVLNRLGAWTGTGINTVLGALIAIVSKLATKPTDLTGNFDPATDSLEAMRDRGDSSWTTGSSLAGAGADQCTFHIVDDLAAPVENAQVWITIDSAGSNVYAGTLLTDSNGDVTFMLDAGNTYYRWVQKGGIISEQGTEFTAVAD